MKEECVFNIFPQPSKSHINLSGGMLGFSSNCSTTLSSKRVPDSNIGSNFRGDSGEGGRGEGGGGGEGDRERGWGGEEGEDG